MTRIVPPEDARKVRRSGAFEQDMRRLAALFAFLVLAAPAAAAPTPDRTAVMSASSRDFAWDGQQATAAAPQHSVQNFDPAKCTKEQDYYCDVTLVKLEAAEGTTAELQFDIFDFSPPIADFDISIFHSDAAGTPGEFIANGGNLSAAGLEETVVVPEAAPGYYLATVSYYFSPDATYKGTIKASGITPAPAAPAPPAGAPPAGSPPATTPPATTTPGLATAPPTVHVRSVTRKGRFVTVRLAGKARRALKLTLRDRRGKVLARGKVARGARVARLRAKRRVAPGRYRLQVGSARGTVRIR
jgi:hypothetical protein